MPLRLLFALYLILTLCEARKHHDMGSGRPHEGEEADIGEEVNVVEARSGENRVSMGEADEPIVPASRLSRVGRHKRALCGHIIGDRLCFLPPFKWRCECGVAGCWDGHCQCKFCG
ncbi:hypothetical protein AAVH_16940 [Aphelenchoides avenae]|nr:hypothetical protein AAVH_16940 [Aphelenchus avenae]